MRVVSCRKGQHLPSTHPFSSRSQPPQRKTQQTQSSKFTQAKPIFLLQSKGRCSVTTFTSLTGSESGAGPCCSAAGSLGSVVFSGPGCVFSLLTPCGCFCASGSGVCGGFTLSALRLCGGLALCCWLVLLLSGFWFCCSDSR